MQVNKKLIIITLILLSLLMINSASAATDTQTNVKSDVIHKEKVTTHIDKTSSSYNNVTKTNTNINAQKELKKKNINNKNEDDGKISSTKKNNDILRADEKTFNELQENITTAADVAKTITLQDDYIQKGTDAITIEDNQKITINGNGHTLDAKGESRIFLVYGELTLENLTLKNGKAQNGGAIYANENSHMSLNNIIFQNNTAPENECNGGAIYAYGADITINNTQFNNNTAFYGGAIGTDSDSNVSISNSNFNNNNATIGGAIYAFSAAVNVTYSDFKNNHAQNYTGAIVFANAHDNFVSYCIFVNNTAPNSGSAIYEYDVGSLEINNTIFLNTDSNTIQLDKPGKVNLNYNWFGNNADNYDTKPIEGSIDNWLFLNATCNNQIMLLKPADISFELYLYNASDTGNEVSDYDASKLKTFNLTITTNNGDIQPKIVQLGDIITYTPNSTGEGGITASIGGINYTKIVKVISETSFTSLYENITKSIESGQQVILTHSYTYDPNTDGNFINGISINTAVQIIGKGITISGNNQARIFHVKSNGNLKLENLTLTNGKAQNGGAIYAERNTYILINNTQFNNNQATTDGGALYTDYSSSTVSISNSNFNNNNATTGGAIYVNGAVNVTCSEFKNNHAQNEGGAILFFNGEDNFVVSCVFGNNTATNGSAIYEINVGNLKINNTIFLNTDNNTIKIKFNDVNYVKLSYNWFGNTNDNYTTKPDIDTSIHISNWLFLNATADPDNITLGTSSEIVFKLYLYNGTDVQDYDNTLLYPVNLTINSVKGEVNPSLTQLGDTITYTPNSSGEGGITASMGDISYTKPVNVIINETSFTALYENITQSLESGQPVIILTHNYTYNDTTDRNLITGIPINTTVHIIGNGFTISGNNLARIFQVTNGGDLTLENLTLTNGKAQKFGYNAEGGAIYAENSHITLNNIIFQNNTAPLEYLSSGGAIYVKETDITINNTQFNNNIAGYGGAIHANGATVSISNSNFNNNTATDIGGAINTFQGDTVSITNSTFNNNTATTSGGAIFAASTMNLVYSEFKNNHAQNGGAIYADSGTVSISNSNFNNNNATYAGAIYNDGMLNATNCIFTNNQATKDGGAIDNGYFKMNIIGSIFNSNKAIGGSGGAISDFYGEVVVRYSNFTKNTSPYKGQAMAGGAAIFCIFEDNTCSDNVVFQEIIADNEFTTTYSSEDKLTFYLVYRSEEYNDIPINITVKNGEAVVLNTIALTGSNNGWVIPYDLEPGIYTVVLSYDKYPEIKEKTVKLTINKIPTNITINTNTITLNTTDTAQINAKLDPSEAGTLMYASNDTRVAIVDKYGMVTAISKGTALITVYFNGEGYYAAAENKTVLVTVNPKEVNTQITSLTIIPKDLFEGKPSIINGTLTTNDNKLANQKITITITNTKGYKETFTGNTDVNGKFSIKIKPGVNGPVTIITTYNGNTTDKYDYKQASNSTSMNVQKVVYNIKLDTIQTSYDYNTRVNITGQITSNYQPLDVKNVNITINGVIKTVALNSTGGFKYVSPYTTNGLYKVLLNCSGTTKNTQYFIKYPTKFTITKIPNTTTNKAITITVKESNRFTGTVNVKLGNKEYKVQLTNGKGNKKIKITKPGKYNVKINYKGNEKYTKTSATSNKFTIKYLTKFIIRKIPNTTTNKVFTICVKGSNRFTGKVNVKIGKKVYKVQLTNGKGNKKIKITKPGKYIAKINYKGNKKYTKTSAKSNKFTIKYPTKFTINKIPNIKTGSQIKLTIKEKNKYTGPVKVTIGSKKYTIKLKKGIGKKTITPKLNPGKYTAKIQFKGNKKYRPAKAASNKFQITKNNYY